MSNRTFFCGSISPPLAGYRSPSAIVFGTISRKLEFFKAQFSQERNDQIHIHDRNVPFEMAFRAVYCGKYGISHGNFRKEEMIMIPLERDNGAGTLNLPPKPDRCLMVFVRDPEPGKVKTRLAGVYGDPFAAELYGCFVDDLLEALERGSYWLEIMFTPPGRKREIRQRFGSRFSYAPQEGEGLGKRMENAFHSCFANGFATALLIGSDFPDLSAEVVEQAFQALEDGHDVALGPAFDGGYYLIGFRSAVFDPAVFREMPWGENTVCEKTLDRLRDRGYRIHLAPAWHDIDTAEDLAALRARHTDGPFSRSRTMTFLRAVNRPFPSD
jgi:uncharacterized protein